VFLALVLFPDYRSNMASIWNGGDNTEPAIIQGKVEICTAIYKAKKAIRSAVHNILIRNHRDSY
jgi:hypothetical protein